MRHCIVSEGLIVNIVEYDQDISGQCPPGFAAAHLAVASEIGQIGWPFVDGAPVAPPPTPPSPEALVLSVKAEAQRRIVALWNARNFDHLMVLEQNASARAIAILDTLTSGGTLTEADTTERTALRALWESTNAIRAASNLIEADTTILPTNIATDPRWPA